MGKKIGAMMIEACEIVERIGPCLSVEVHKLMVGGSKYARIYLVRSVHHGLVSVDVEKSPHQYQIVPGWREKIAASGGNGLSDEDVNRSTERGRRYRERQRALAEANRKPVADCDDEEEDRLPWMPLHDANSTVSMALRTQPNSVFALAEVMA